MFVNSIPKQLHVSKSSVEPHELLDSIKNNFKYLKVDPGHPNIVFKPNPDCGLWTSSWLGGPDFSDWVRWCNSQHFGPDVWQGFLLDAQKDARIFEIDNLYDYIYLRENYTKNYSTNLPTSNLAAEALKSLKLRTVDFELMSQDIDAIHLTENGECVTRLPYLTVNRDEDKDLANLLGADSMALYGWDCESTLWLNPKYENVEYIGKIKATFNDWSE